MEISSMEREAVVSVLNGLVALQEEDECSGSEVYELLRELVIDTLLNYKDLITNSQPDIVDGSEFSHYGHIGKTDDVLKIVTSVETEVADSLITNIVEQLSDLAYEG